MYLSRDIEKTLLVAGKSFQALVIYGARQIGKSTTVDHIFGDGFNRVSLDDVDDLDLALNDSKGFLSRYSWPLAIDEVQKAPKLLNAIKAIIDQQRLIWLKNGEERKLMYILTGSNQFELQEGISESLAGRAAVIDMASLTQMEILQVEGHAFDPDINNLLEKEKLTSLKYVDRSEIFRRIFKGGMPDIVLNTNDTKGYFKSYFATYIEKDVRKFISASHESQFRKFVSYIALRTAQQVNFEVFSRELGIDSATCKRWLSILETSGIVILLEPYMANISKRIIKSPKIYFMDTGLCAYLCGWEKPKILENCAMSGAFFETFVVSEIVKSFYNHNLDVKNTLFYYRDIDQKEIDLLYIKNNAIYPIEIKKGILPSKPTKNFNVLSKYNQKIEVGLVIDNSDKIRPINDKAYTFPVYLLGI